MFLKFDRKPTHAATASQVKKVIDAHRDDIRRRMVGVEELNTKLTEAVRKTSETTNDLVGKVSQELKIAKKSLTTIASSISDGVLMVDHVGKIVHVNRPAAKALGIGDRNVVGSSVCDVVRSNDPVFAKGFFKRLSQKIFDAVKSRPHGEKIVACNSILCDDICADLAHAFGVRDSNVHMMVLDNDPESIHDLMYIFLFGHHK